MLLMLTAAPVLWEGDSGLKFRDLVVEFSRWVLGPRVLPTVDYRLPNRWGRSESPKSLLMRLLGQVVFLSGRTAIPLSGI